MAPLPARHSWLMQGPYSRVVHRHGGVQLVPGLTQLDTLQPVVGNWNEKDLREQFHDCLRDQNRFPDVARAEKLMSEMRLRPAEFPRSELSQYEEILTSAKEHETLSKTLVEIGKDGKPGLAESAQLISRAQVFQARLNEARPPIVAEVGTLLTNEQLHMSNRLLAQSRDALRGQYVELVRALNSVHHAAEAIEAILVTGIDAFRKRSLTFAEINRRIDDVEKHIEHYLHGLHDLRPQYLGQVPVLRENFFDNGLGMESEELKKLIRLRKVLKIYREQGRRIPSIFKLEHKIAADMAISDETRVTPLVSGVVIRVKTPTGKRIVRILGTRGNRKSGGQLKVQASDGTSWVEPGELYFLLLMESGYGGGYGEAPDIAKDRVMVLPALNTKEDVERAVDLDSNKGEHLVVDQEKAYLRSEKMNSDVLIGGINESAKTIDVGHSYNAATKEWKTARMGFQEFVDFWKKHKIKHTGTKGDPRNWTATYWTQLGSSRKGSGRSLLSIGSVLKAMKYLDEGIKRMGSERNEVNGANLARWASKYLDKVPYMHGIMDTIQTQSIGLIMAKVFKWKEEYGKTLKTAEFEDAFKDFYNLPKWKQAALLLAGAEKGLTKPEVYHILKGEGIDPSKWDRKDGKPVTHQMYVSVLKEYFTDEGDASYLPLKVESSLTPLLDKGYGKGLETGFDESKSMFDGSSILAMHRAYFTKGWKANEDGTRTNKHNMTKRTRAMGTFASALKLGIDAQTMGKFTLWLYSTVESSSEKDKMYNNFTGTMMRQIGNSGKAWIPMLGLYRFPKGMALARAIIDYYSECTGVNPFDVKDGRPNDAEEVLGYIFAGQWAQVEDKLMGQLNHDQFNTLKYLYYKARGMTYLMEEGGDFSSHLWVGGATIDEDTITDAYGVSGMLSSRWLANILKTDESGSGQADHHYGVYMEREGALGQKGKGGGWWDRLPEKLGEVTEDERKLFAFNFWEILNKDIAVREQHFRRHWRQIKAVLDVLIHDGHGNIRVDFTDGNKVTSRDYDASNPHVLDLIDRDLSEMQHHDSATYIRDMHIPHEWMSATADSIGKGKDRMGRVFRDAIVDDGLNPYFGYDVDIKKQIRTYIKEAQGWKEYLARSDMRDQRFDMNEVRRRTRSAIGDNFDSDPDNPTNESLSDSND